MTEESIFVAALEQRDSALRQAFLDEVCGGDTALRRRVEALLGFHEGGNPFLQKPIVEQLGGCLAEDLARKQTDDTPSDPVAAGHTEVLHFLEPSRRPGSLGRLKHYEILEVLGQGGFGTVLKAFDERLHRVIAIKVLTPHLAGNTAACQRFLREARAAAAVRHDNVIDIHAVEDEPVPYLVMGFIDGPTLQQKMDRIGQMPAREVLRIGAQIAAGLAAAHQQGLVHRDVKPSNILLENGVERVKLTDFGLARATDDTSLTQSGIVAGTPQYMSPEQAMGEQVDQRSDLFSLGSVLYAMCTGHLPFHAGSSLALLKRVCEDTPRPVHELNSDIPLCLADDIARLHAKQPGARFQSAAEIRDRLMGSLAELQERGTASARIASGVKTGKETRTQAELPQGKNFPRIFRSPRFLVSFSAIVLVGMLVGYLVMNQPRGTPNDGNAAGAPPPATPSTPTYAADKLRQKEIFPALLPELDRSVGDAPVELIAILGKGPFLHKEHGPNTEVQCLAYSPDGKTVVSANARFDPVTSSFSSWEVKLWDAETGKPLRNIGHHESAVHGLAFSPDGRRVVTGCRDGTVKVWDMQTGNELLNLNGSAANIRGVAYSPDGKWIAACSDRATDRVLLWNAVSGEKKLAFNQYTSGVLHVAFSPDSSLLAGAGDVGDGSVRVWETDSGKEICRLICNSETSRSVAFSHDNKRIVTVGHSFVGQVWDIARQQVVFDLKGHTGTVLDVACSADGAHIATASLDGTARLWNAANGDAIRTFSGQPRTASCVAFRPDCKALACGDGHGQVNIWETSTGKQLLPPAHNGQVHAVAITPDGKLLASAGRDATLRVWDLATGDLRHLLTGHGNGVHSVAISPDSTLIASGGEDNTVRFWNPVTGAEAHPPLATASPVRQVAFAPQGALLATAESNGTVTLWQIPGGKVLHSFPNSPLCWCVAFHPKSAILAAGFSDGAIHLWDISKGIPMATLRGHTAAVRGVAFHPNGETLASTADVADPKIRLWNVAMRKEKTSLKGHSGPVLTPVWRADGEVLASCGGIDGTVRLWDMKASRPSAITLALFPGGAHFLHDIALTPEGRYLASANADGTIFVLKLTD
jgi:WD40 repeat protein/serine/threonine protein kinase